MELLPFGQQVEIIHKYLEFETGWITNAKPSYFNGHDWRYNIRTDKRLRSGYFLWGGAWFDEMHLRTIDDGEPLSPYLNIPTPEMWPPVAIEPKPTGRFADEAAWLDGVIGKLVEVMEGLSIK